MELSSLGIGTNLGIEILRGSPRHACVAGIWGPAARTPPGPRGRAGVNPPRPFPSTREVPWS